ncbi:D-2-hydroxyacid dehydrogenase [Ruminococcus sp. AF18-22]|nr:D-2-hydroxyacid dehydrogenase [Ruminococcus sp. AF18-22]
MKIVILDGYTENPGDLSWSELECMGELEIYDRTGNDNELIIQRMKDAEIVLTNKTPITSYIIEHSEKLKYIGVLATGYNVIDVDAAHQKGIVVTNIPTYGTDAVAQYTIGLLLEICHHIGHHDAAVKNGKWQQCADWCFWDYPLIELAGKTAGIIGFGRIGQAVGKLMKAFGMKIYAYDAHPSLQGKDIAEYVDLDTIFKCSDVISLHCPLTNETENLIRESTLGKMKQGVILLNASRGALIDEQALSDAIKNEKVYAAAVDVVSTEPILANNPLLKAKNCIITPHIAWAAKESRKRLMDIAINNVQSFLNGEPINMV